MKSIKAEIIPHSGRVVEKAGHEFTLPACVLSTDTTRSALPRGVAELRPAGAFVLAAVLVLPSQLLLGHKIVSAGGNFLGPGKGAYIP